MHLGDYGGGGNGNRKAVSLRNSRLRHRERKFVGAVDQEKIRLYRQLADSGGHGSKGGLEDIYAVYFNVIHDPDADSEGAGADLFEKIFSPLGGELF
jgi:hypothetical protein